jgi:two-component system, sensor histidine kinase YesM
MKKRSRRIQATITLAFAVLVLATALVMALLSYAFTAQAVQQTSRDYTTQLIAQVQGGIDSYITHMENIAEVVQLNEQVQEYLGITENLSPDEAEEYRRRITTFLNSISRTRDDISLILIAGDNGDVLTHDRSLSLNPVVHIPDQEWYRRAKAASGRAVISSSGIQNVIDGQYRWVITLSRTINNPATAEEYGVMLVDLNFSVISRLLSRISLGRRGYLFVVDSRGGIVYHPRQELIYSDLEREYIDRVVAQRRGSFSVRDEKGERLYTVSTSDRTGWRTVGVNYVSELVQNRQTIQRYYFYWTLICIVLAILVSVIISHRLSMPILRLRSTMRAVEQGTFNVTADITRNDEIGDLARDFNIMIAQIKELVRRNAEEQEEKRKSELMALQNQITPHFLYNTLDSVIWMAEAKQHELVVRMVSALARLLRLSISRGEELVTIRDEIAHIGNYLTIQKMRYRDKLDYTIEVDEEIMGLYVPKIILQPLVENAIYHGIKNRQDGGRVTVAGSTSDGTIVLSVRDDGVGMSPDQMEGILQPGSDIRRRRRVGVRNVHERIQLYFGSRYGLTFSSEPDRGTIVEIHLPLVEEGDSYDEG